MKQRVSRVSGSVLSIILLVSLSAGVSGQSAEQRERAIRVTLLQLNDVYQQTTLDRGKNAGLARVATLRKQVLGQSPNTLFLLGGDTISPSVASSIFKGEQMIAAWNALGLDYAVLGNHEFDFGNEILLKRMAESKFTWLGSNVIDRNTGKPFNGMPPFVIREFEGVKVGLFGLLTVDTATSSKPGPNIRFVDPVLAAGRVVRQMRARGANVIIAVTHLTMSEDKRLARTGLVDVIIGGHEHDFMQSHAGHAPIFKWGSDARILGRIDLNIYSRKRRLESIDWYSLPVTDAVPDDPAAAAVIKGYESRVSTELDKAIGRTAVELDATALSNRNRETELGNLIADAFRSGTGAEVALLNGGAIRANMKYAPGEITKRDLIAMLPFETPVVKVEISGALLKAALENGVSQVVEEKESGRFPQVSGMAFEYDARKPVGSRVVSVTIGGQPLDEKKKYALATNAYLAGGGDGYTMLKGLKFLIEQESAEIDSTILGNAISAGKEVSPKVEGRIKRLDQ
ncbi:MAG: bifunctional metallophosphatase/5'-nucleotidase [Blastocatellia bacterium]